jgi:hypothetical protein
MVERRRRSMAKVVAQDSSGRTSAGQGRMARLVKRFGVLGFVFFFVKGLLWLSAPALLAYFGLR